MNILKRFLSVTLGSLILLGAITPIAHAGDLIVGGQTHEYKVVLRGDGRAIVFGKLIVPNTGTNAISTFDIDLGVQDADQIVAYQLIVPQSCSKFDTSVTLEVGEDTKCVQYKDISTRDFTNAEYEKISTVEVNNSSYTLTLPSPVHGYASAAILIAYSTKEYTSNLLGMYSYDFKTPTVDDRIERTSVSIQTDSDLYLDGEDTTIHYDDSIVTSDVAFESVSGLSAESALTSIDSNRGNSIRSSATDLFPGESYEVTGHYSEYWWRFYLLRIIIGVLIAGALIGFGIWRYKKMPKTTAAERPNHKIVLPVTITDSPTFMGLFSALMIGIWTMIAINVMEGNLIGRIHNDVAEILVGFVIFMVYLLVGIGPSISLGHRKGWSAGIMTFIGTIIWLIVGIIIFSSSDIDPVIPYEY